MMVVKQIFKTLIVTTLCVNVLAIGLLFVSCKNEKNSDTKATTISEEFNTFLEDYYQEGLQLNPLDATYQGDNRYNDKLPNFLSEAYKEKTKAYYNTFKLRLENFEEALLSDSEKMTKAVLTWNFNMSLEALNYQEDLMPINQFSSFNLDFGQLASGSSAQPFKTVKDYNNWLKRLESYLEWMASAKTNMQKGIKEGYVLPKALIVKTLPQLKALTNTNLEEHLFYTPAKNFPESFSEENKTALTEAYTQIVSEKIIPAYQGMYDFMSTDYLKAGRETSGIYDIPNGEAYYKYLIKANTTTDMAADEIHQLGLSEVKRILGEMEKVKEEVGYKGDLKSFFNNVRSNKKLMPFTEPKQVIDNFMRYMNA